MTRLQIQKLEEAFHGLIEEGFIIFCGAGISIPPPSCSPSWWQLTEEILKAFFDRVPDDYNIPKDMILKDPSMQPEIVFEAFSNVLDERMYRAFEALDVTEPNANHYTLARLAKKGVLKACFTTNFDVYLEKALKEEGVDFELLVDNIEYIDFFEKNMKENQDLSKFILCKVHGTIERPNTIVSVASAYKSVKGFSAPKGTVFENLLKRYPCLFLGYSGWDFNHLNYRRFWERVGPQIKGIWWNRRPNEVESPNFQEIFSSCWDKFEFVEAELPIGLIKAIEKSSELKLFVADLTMRIYENAIARYAQAEVDRIRFFKKWVEEFPESHFLGLVITESQKFSSSFREFMKQTQEISEDTEAVSYDVRSLYTEFSQKMSSGEISAEEYQQKVFEISIENAMRMIRNSYKPGIREMIRTNKFPGITDNSSNLLTFVSMLISTTRNFELEEASKLAADYTYKTIELMKENTDEARADQVILGFEVRIMQPKRDDWKEYVALMYEEKAKYLSKEIDYTEFSANLGEIVQKATYDSIGMTVDIFELLNKQVEVTTKSTIQSEFEDQVGALSITTMQIAPYLNALYNKNQVYLDILDVLSQVHYPEEHRDASKRITKDMLDRMDSLIRKPFLLILEKAEEQDRTVKLLMEMSFLTIWIQGVQYLDQEGMKKYQKMWDAGEYPKRFCPKVIYNYLKQKVDVWLEEALNNLPARFAQKLCGNLAIMGEMGDDLDLCERATLRSLELSEGLVTEATPENIPGNLAAFYERLGDTEKALKYYMICLDAIKLTYPPTWADAIVYRTALLLSQKGEKRKALKTIGMYHPSFRGNASSVVLMSRKKCEEFAEVLAEDLGYTSAQFGVTSILG